MLGFLLGKKPFDSFGRGGGGADPRLAHLALKPQLEGLLFNVGCETGYGKGKGCVLLNEQEAYFSRK